ncbi:MAG: M20/M25/M40 family metallo-hydrolase, partial [bacterium]
MRKLALVLGAAGLALAGVLGARTLRSGTRQPVVAALPPVAVDADRAAQTLAGALRLQTVSHQDPAAIDAAQFRGLIDYLQARFPRVHAALTRETVNDYSLLYTWSGSGSGKPVLLLAHLDVVPIEDGSEAQWTQPPFAGAIADGFIWGRGALDDKNSVLAILEAVELLLAAGVQPARPVILAFGHDE